MISNQRSYASPISFTRATPFLWSIVSDRQSTWGKTLAVVLCVPATALLWVGLTLYYALMFTVFALPFTVWRLWRRNERRSDLYRAEQHAQWAAYHAAQWAVVQSKEGGKA
jgi:hypothetical protein